MGLFREARERIPHTLGCGIERRYPCSCDWEERFLALLAQGVEAAILASGAVYDDSRHDETAGADAAVAALRAVVSGEPK